MQQRAQSAKPSVVVPPRTIQSAASFKQRTPSSTGTRRIFSAKPSLANLFEVIPKEVIFTDIVPNQKYEMFVLIRNLSNKPCRIRVSQPKTTKFKVDYDMQQGIAAGLAMKILVMFQSNTIDDFKDVVHVQSDEFQTDILLSALKCCASLQYEQFVDFGYVQQGTDNSRQLAIKNIGQTTGKVQFKTDLPNIKIVPNLLTVDANQTSYITIQYKANDMGNFRGTIDLLVDGQSRKIDIAATSVDYARFLLDTKGAQIQIIDFGEFYVGKQKVQKFKYFNNSPLGYQYKIISRKGHHSLQEDTINLQTPNELGVEQSERIITVKPDRGYIQAYAQVELEITCQSNLTLKEQMQARSCCFSEKLIDPKEFKYSLIFTQPQEDMVILVNAKQIVPIVKINKQNLQFGECEVNDNKDILMNINNINNMAIDVQFSKVSCFFFKPEKVTIPALASTPVQVTFMPKNVGKYNQMIEIILNEFLSVPMKAIGEVNKIAKKRPLTRGPEARPEHFDVDPKFIDTQQIQYEKKRQNDLFDLQINPKARGVEGYFMDSERTAKPIEQQKQGNNFLVDQRSHRLEKQRKQIIESRLNEIQKKQSDPSPRRNQPEQQGPPQDLEFELGIMNEGTAGDVDFKIKKDPLFVVKPIEQYEPIKVQEEEIVKFKADPNQPVKRLLSARPQSHKQVRDVHLELSPEELKKIYAGPIKIDFGTIYVNTIMYKTFSVKNDLRNAILCRMIVDKDEVKATYKQPQVIDSGQTGQFQIGICAQGLGQFKQNLKYILNEKHVFEILLVANVETVKLELSKNTVKIGFTEDSTSMTSQDTIKLTNNGVGEASFQFWQPENTKFNVQPISGVIPASSFVSITIIYTPSLIIKNPEDPDSDAIFKQQNPTRQDDEKLVLKVKDGQDQSIKLIGIVNDIKCTTKSVVDLGEVCVCTIRSGTFQVKNTSRSNAVYRILNDYLPKGCSISPNQGRIAADDNKEFTLKFESNFEQDINTNILFMLRSGRVLRIPLTIKCQIPKIQIAQDIFDFGEVTTLGNQTAQPLTIINKSQVDVELIIDLRGDEINPNANDGVGCLLIKQQQDLLKSFVEDGGADSQEEDEQNKNLKREKSNKKLLLKVPAGQTLNFDLHFYPKEMKSYTFQFPIELHHFGPIESLKRQVICRGSQPKFIILPKHVDFGRKIILSPPEKNKASIQEILLSNIEYRSVSFKITIDNDDKIFQIIPLAGRVDGGQTLRVKAMFNPRYDGVYQKNVNVYLEDSKPNQPYMVISLQGQAAKPSILFDRREIILPPVPLGIESRVLLKLFNDGFEGQKLTIKGIQGFQAEFLDGSTVGITKNTLDVVVKFSSQTPISISQPFEIIDETQHSYSVTASGTADNCSLTTFSYLDSDKNYEIIIDKKGPPQLQEGVQESDQEESQTSSKKVTFQIKTKPTKQLTHQQVEQKCDHFCRWFNLFIGQMQEFPQSVINSNGQPLLDMISSLSNKNQFPFKVNLEGVKQRVQIVQIIFNFFKELTLMLKVDGALLNQIRPYYLLNYDDYLLHLKSVDSQFTHPQYQKMPQDQFDYTQKMCYLSLVYQILKIYYLPRVNLKSIRQLQPNFYEYPQSNIYSSSESILIKWIETQVSGYWRDANGIRIKSYQDFQDGQYLAALALSYTGQGGLKYFQPLGQTQLKNQQDITHNMSILSKGLEDVGIENQFNQNEFNNLTYPETTLLLMALYTQLPNYVPKSQPLLFTCVLGSVVVKTVTIQNPTKETLNYRVKLEGSLDFSIEEDSVSIEPGGKCNFNIKFTSRISDEQSAILTFANRKDTKSIAAALVYELKGQITGRVSQKIWTVTGTQYEMKEFQITVVNQFTTSEFGSFNISIIPIKIPLVIEQPKKKKKAMSMAEKKKDAEQELKEKQRLDKLQNLEPIPAFFCKQDSLRLKRGAQYNLSLLFLPLQFHLQKCQIVFQDPQVGEFQYEIVGTVDPPDVTIEVRPEMQVFIDQQIPFSHHIPFINPLYKNALKMIDQLSNEKKRISMQRQNSNHSTKPPPILPIEDIQFTVTCEEAKSYIDADKIFTLVNYQGLQMMATSKTEEQEDVQSKILNKSDDAKNRLGFVMNFKTACKDYMSLFTLTNETKTDVRRLRVQVTSLPKPVKAILEMTAPAREVVQQDIPIVNSTERDFNLKVTLTGDPRFTILSQGDQKKKQSKDYMIKKKTNGVVTVQFSPDWICQCEGHLQIYNPLTSDVQEYQLIGKGEEPLSEGHFNIKAVARQPLTQTIKVDNPLNQEVRYYVETDLINAAGQSEIIIPPLSTYDYVLSINPLLSGQFTGSVTFTGNGIYRWWTLTIDTQTPKAVSTVELIAPIRKAVAFDIEISNPLAENITYEVLIEGEALTGQKYFSVLPGTTSVYELVFQPITEGSWKGTIAFLHPKMGEIWYQLNLVGEDRGGVRVPQFKTELGKTDRHEILLENPTGKQITAEVSITNPTNFAVEFEGGNQLLLEPYTLKPIYVVFTPSALSAHSGEIIITTKEIGKWIYICFGTGETPTPFHSQQVICKVGNSVTNQVEFKNPLRDPLLVTLNIEQEGAAFQLLINKKQLTIQPQTTLQIPYQFVPDKIAAFKCNIVLQMNTQVRWTYPVIGQTEFDASNTVFKISTKCRIPLKTQLLVHLEGLAEKEKVMFKITDLEQIKKQLSIGLKDMMAIPGQPLVFDVNFNPMKPFRIESELQIKVQSGGLWKYKIIINAKLPQVDDVIVIESDIGKLAKVQFKLTNRYEEFANFRAYFTPESHQEFSVEPQSGVLEPFGKMGTEFKVGLKPKEYGKKMEAKLIIQTEHMFWSYILKGHLPKYIPPQPGKKNEILYSQISHGDQKNHIIENLKVPRVSPPRRK